MNAETSKVTDLGTKNSAPSGQVSITGKVSSAVQAGQNWFTRIMMPATDEYSSPNTVEVRSERSWTSQGNVVTCVAAVGGYTRKSGDSVFCNNTLDYISH